MDLLAITDLTGLEIGWWQTSLSSLTPAILHFSESRHYIREVNPANTMAYDTTQGGIPRLTTTAHNFINFWIWEDVVIFPGYSLMKRIVWHTQNDPIPKCLDLRNNGQKKTGLQMTAAPLVVLTSFFFGTRKYVSWDTFLDIYLTLLQDPSYC